MSDFRRMGFGSFGVSYQVSEEVSQVMRALRPPQVISVRSGPSPLPQDPGSSPDGQLVTQGRRRDAKGRLLPRPLPDPGIDEHMTYEEVRDGLRRLMGQLPKGSLASLASECGFSGKWRRQSLRRWALGNGIPVEASRRRISRVLSQISRGDLVCVDTGTRHGKYPVFRWERRAKPVKFSPNYRKA